jgi:hypothetical protein
MVFGIFQLSVPNAKAGMLLVTRVVYQFVITNAEIAGHASRALKRARNKK